MEGVDLYAVGQILGHKTPRITQRYENLSPDYMAGAVGKLDGIMGGMLPTPVDSVRLLEGGTPAQARFAEAPETSAA
jgi:hypothetical protein